MTSEEFAARLALGHETRRTEFKPPGSSRDTRLFALVAKAALGMINTQDGGEIFVGVSESNGNLNPVGLKASDLLTWNYDQVAEKLSSYADPPVEFEVEVVEYNGGKFVVISIREFEDIPVLCNKDYPGELRKGACYVRSRRKPETTEIPTQADMRALLDLATQKGMRQWLEQAQRNGLLVLPQATASPTMEELFRRQRGDL